MDFDRKTKNRKRDPLNCLHQISFAIFLITIYCELYIYENIVQEACKTNLR